MVWLPFILTLPYIFTLLYLLKFLKNLKPFNPAFSPESFASVVIACRNEQANVAQLLNRIVDQDYPRNLFEVIVVDDNSDDKTSEIASCFKNSLNLQVLNSKGQGKKKAIQTGITAASGELIITTDADCLMKPGWIRTIAAFYEENRPDLIILPVQIEPMSGFFGRFQEMEFLSLQGITAGSAAARNSTMCNGANLAFTREAYLNNVENLHFEILTGDDIFFLHSLKRQKNSEILWLESQEAGVITRPAPDVSSYFRQRKRWISKSASYRDLFSIVLGIVTFVTILIQAALPLLAIFDPRFLLVFLAVFLLKSFSDFLILHNTASRYNRKELLKWFFPSQLIYPYYVLAVSVYAFTGNRRISSPFPKGT